MNLLERHGASVYLDVEDSSFQQSSPKEIAERLRSAIRACGRLVVIVAEHTQTSRWLPWEEMGIADVRFGESRVASMPVRPYSFSAEDWSDQAWFNLYARIEPAPVENAPIWLVRTSDRLWISLSEWIQSTRPSC